MKINKKTMDELSSMLNAWHGNSDGRGVLVKFHPEPIVFASAVDKVLAKTIPPWERKLNAIKSAWSDIAGEETARRCRVSHLNNAVLYIEVFHPAYRITLENPKIKAMLLEKIRTLLGDTECRELKFIPCGRMEPVRKKTKAADKTGKYTPELPL